MSKQIEIIETDLQLYTTISEAENSDEYIHITQYDGENPDIIRIHKSYISKFVSSLLKLKI